MAGADTVTCEMCGGTAIIASDGGRTTVSCQDCSQWHDYDGEAWESHDRNLWSSHPAPLVQRRQWPARLLEFERVQAVGLVLGAIDIAESDRLIAAARETVAMWHAENPWSIRQEVRDRIGLWLEDRMPALFRRLGGRVRFWGKDILRDDDE